MKRSYQALSGFLGCPSLPCPPIRPFVQGVQFWEYHDSEVGPWDFRQCLVALHRSARVGSSPGKCQIPLVFSDLCIDFTRSRCEQWEEEGAPHLLPAQRAGVEDTVQNGPWLVDGTLVVLTGALGWQCRVWNRTAPLSTGLQLHHGLSVTLLLPKEFGRGNGEQLLESNPSARADPAYSLLPILYLFLMCFILSRVDPPACKASTPNHL